MAGERARRGQPRTLFAVQRGRTRAPNERRLSGIHDGRWALAAAAPKHRTTTTSACVPSAAGAGPMALFHRFVHCTRPQLSRSFLTLPDLSSLSPFSGQDGNDSGTQVFRESKIFPYVALYPRGRGLALGLRRPSIAAILRNSCTSSSPTRRPTRVSSRSAPARVCWAGPRTAPTAPGGRRWTSSSPSASCPSRRAT